MKALLVSLFLMFVTVSSWAQQDIDYKAIESQLNGEGLGGWVHGNFKNQNLFVFTWRHPDNFFVNVQFPIVTRDLEVRKVLTNLKRHDFITLKGSFLKNKAPLQHIHVTEVVNLKKWKGPGSDLEYDYKISVPKELLTKTELVGKVHAVIPGGRGLVVEYKDVVVPVFTNNADTTKGLFRNDKIKLSYVIQRSPRRPAHLNIDLTKEVPLTVLKRIEDGHGETVTLKGALVMFPKSPQIRFNVYALRFDDGETNWNYTIVNFDDFDLFKALREKLEAAWNEKSEFAIYDRNKFLNSKIKITVTGVKNVVDEGQANPQVLVNSLDDLKIEFL